MNKADGSNVNPKSQKFNLFSNSKDIFEQDDYFIDSKNEQ